MVVASQLRNPHALKRGCVNSGDAFVSVRGLVNAVRKGRVRLRPRKT